MHVWCVSARCKQRGGYGSRLLLLTQHGPAAGVLRLCSPAPRMPTRTWQLSRLERPSIVLDQCRLQAGTSSSGRVMACNIPGS